MLAKLAKTGQKAKTCPNPARGPTSKRPAPETTGKFREIFRQFRFRPAPATFEKNGRKSGRPQCHMHVSQCMNHPCNPLAILHRAQAHCPDLRDITNELQANGAIHGWRTVAAFRVRFPCPHLRRGRPTGQPLEAHAAYVPIAIRPGF